MSASPAKRTENPPSSAHDAHVQNVRLEPRPHQDILEQIAEVSRNSRSTWFGLLAVMLFCAITLMGHQDADFFAAGSGTQLPALGTSTPPESFFLGAPLLILGVFVYLHIYLVKLWRALAAAPLVIEEPGQPQRRLDEAVFPWLINDAALQWRPDRFHNPFGWITGAGVFVLGWALAPMLIAAFWIRSMPLHDELLTTFLGALLWIAVAVAATSWRTARKILSQRDPTRTTALGWIAGGLLFALLTLISWLTTEAGLYGPTEQERAKNAAAIGNHNVGCDYTTFADGWNCFWQDFALHGDEAFLVPADLKGARLVYAPQSYQPYALALADFRQAYILRQRAEHGPNWRDRPIAPANERARGWEDVMHLEFAARRAADRVLFARRDLAHADLRRANLDGAFLDGVDLGRADLSRASLLETQLEGARLSRAKLADARLFRARLEHASLFFADLSRANMTGARLDSAKLNQARLSQTKLTSAAAPRAAFSEADLTNAYMSNAVFDGAVFYEADLTEAALTSSSFKRAVFARAQFAGANLSSTKLQEANFYGAKMEGAFLVKADLTDANFEFAALNQARLMEALAHGARLRKAKLSGADFTDANLAGATLVGAVMQDAQISQSQLSQTFGDAQTELPQGLARPTTWPAQQLDYKHHDDAWATWRRGAQEAR